jgi:hypothetical protein
MANFDVLVAMKLSSGLLSSMKFPVLLNAQFEPGLMYRDEAPLGVVSASYVVPLIVASLSPQLICNEN